PGAERTFLIHLLKECSSLKHISYSAAEVSLRGSLAEWTYRAFAETLSDATSSGLPRKYERTYSVGHAVKGRIDFTAHIRPSWPPDGRIPPRSFPLSFDNPLTRGTASVCDRLSFLTESQETRDLLTHSGSILRRGGVRSQPLEGLRPHLR